MKSLRILSGGATHGVVETARAEFEKANGCTIEGTFSAVGAMRDKSLAGEPADVMILSRALIDELAASGHVATASIRDNLKVIIPGRERLRANPESRSCIR